MGFGLEGHVGARSSELVGAGGRRGASGAGVDPRKQELSELEVIAVEDCERSKAGMLGKQKASTKYAEATKE
jgi:hypothetical protein